MFNRLKNFWQRKKIAKLKKRYVFLLIIFLVIFLVLLIVYSIDVGSDEGIVYGVTYSHKYAQELGLNWQDAFSNMIDDLGVRNFRLMAYWDGIEQIPGQYDFSELDWLLRRAQYSGAQVIMVVGRRQPRWPECHQPAWVEDLSLTGQQAEELNMIKNTVSYLKKYPNIVAWQVDNEPFLSVFGECLPVDKDFYQQKLDLVRSLDNRPTIMTDSGELSTWVTSANLNPILGTSIYRHVWNQYYGDFIYPMPPVYYYWKYRILQRFTPLEEVFVSELQQEPWSDQELTKTSLADQFASIDLDKFVKNIKYVEKIGFSKVYLWGAEWWYWLKVKQGDDGFWQAAKQVFNK